jgi:hypothetical protein
MGFTSRFYTKHDFVFTQCYGIIDDSSLYVHLLNFNIEAEANGMKTIKELVDTRRIKNVDKATIRGLIELVAYDAERSSGRLEFLSIVVADPLIEEMASIYASSINASKEDVGIFHDVNTALSWLGYNEQDVYILSKFMNKHRV